MQQKETISVSQAAVIFGVSRQTVLNWINAGYLGSIKTQGGHYRIPLEEMNKFLAGGRKGRFFFWR